MNQEPSNGPSTTGLLLALIGLALLIIFSGFYRCSTAHADSFGPEEDPLVQAMHELRPRLPVTVVRKHVAWARAATDRTRIEPERILAMVIIESELNRFAVSRIECVDLPFAVLVQKHCVRKTGVLRTKTANVRGPYFCGVLQLKAQTWEECQSLASDPERVYALAVEHLEGWLDEPICANSNNPMRCALTGYGGGYRLIKRFSTRLHRYPRKIEALTRRLKKASELLVDV